MADITGTVSDPPFFDGLKRLESKDPRRMHPAFLRARPERSA